MRIELRVESLNEFGATVALVKKAEGVLDNSRSIASQVHVMGVSEGPYFEALYALVKHCMNPCWKFFMSGGGARESEKSVNLRTKAVSLKMSELEVSLFNCKNDVRIPRVVLSIHPSVPSLRRKSASEGLDRALSQLESDTAKFLNELQFGVNTWIKDIQRVTKLERVEAMPTDSNTMQEIRFWLDLESELSNLSRQLHNENAQFTLNVLRQCKRFHATASFDTDTIGLRRALECAQNYKGFMKEFPIDGLLTASDLHELGSALRAVFDHLKKSKHSGYPIPRYLRLVEAIGRDFFGRMAELLKRRRLMDLSYAEFEEVFAEAQHLFGAWDEQFAKFRELLREWGRGRRQGEESSFLLANVSNRALEDRIYLLRAFRGCHEQFTFVFEKILLPEFDPDVFEGERAKLSEVYELARHCDPLSFDIEERESWSKCMNQCNSAFDEIELVVVRYLKLGLESARTLEEMLQALGRFKPLFFRPNVRIAVREYHTHLLGYVSDEIRRLYERFKRGYPGSEDAAVSSARGIPPVSGSIIWTRQIERRLKNRVKNAGDALCDLDAEGKKLREDYERFLQKLDTDSIFQNWLQEVENYKYNFADQVLKVVKKGPVFCLSVNFPPQLTEIYREAQILQTLGYRIPFSVSLLSSGARQLHPFALRLRESVQFFEQLSRSISPEASSDVSPLLDRYKKGVQTCLIETLSSRWIDVEALASCASRLSESICLYAEKTKYVLRLWESIRAQLLELAKCKFEREQFNLILQRVQASIDELSLSGYANLGHWVGRIERIVESTLTERLEDAVRTWTSAFDSLSLGDSRLSITESKSAVSAEPSNEQRIRTPKYLRSSDNFSASQATTAVHDQQLSIASAAHELVVRGNSVLLQPPLEQDRLFFLSQFDGWISAVTRIQCIHYGAEPLSPDEGPRDFRRLLRRMSPGVLSSAYKAIERPISLAQRYFRTTWLQYQDLWDAESSAPVSSRIASLSETWPFRAWRQLLSDAEEFFGTALNEADGAKSSFGPILINCGQARADIGEKCSDWLRRVSHGYELCLQREMSSLYRDVSSYFSELSASSAPMPPRSALSRRAEFVRKVREAADVLSERSRELEEFSAGQSLLSDRGHALPPGWLDFSVLEAEWQKLSELVASLSPRADSVAREVQREALERLRSLDGRVSECRRDWGYESLLESEGGSVGSEEEQVAFYERRLSEMSDEAAELGRALELLRFNVEAAEGDVSVNRTLEDLAALESGWRTLVCLWGHLNDLRQTRWSDVDPADLRARLEGLRGDLERALGCGESGERGLRSPSGLDVVLDQVSRCLKLQETVVDLKSEALRERHWKRIWEGPCRRASLRSGGPLTLGDVWDSEFESSELKSIVRQAQGELALERFIESVKGYWSARRFEFVERRRGVLIHRWNELFARLEEHLSGIDAMKVSPYFESFEVEALNWEERLGRAQSLLDTWVDVQRQWTYLESIFFGGAGKAGGSLMRESAAFGEVDSEFRALMERTKRSSLVMEVMEFEGLRQTLERLSERLRQTQKSLSEYLETWRTSFPRFYFLGDEDLLDVLGSRECAQRKIRKMFPGVSELVVEGEEVRGMVSVEGELVVYRNPVSVFPRRDDTMETWLNALSLEIKSSLAQQLLDAARGVRAWMYVTDTSGDTNATAECVKWASSYATQIVLLCVQLRWTELTERALEGAECERWSLEVQLEKSEEVIYGLASAIPCQIDSVQRRKLEQLMAELVRQLSVTRRLSRGARGFEWQRQMRFYLDPRASVVDLKGLLTIRMADTCFEYGFEYAGATESLIRTPLTDRCFVALTQAIQSRMGGSPYGSAGTGKTETVKALGRQLGRLVLVFCCDRSFDSKAMTRIFAGLAMCGAWGCFDEFNRLEEVILSDTSQQIQALQLALKEGRAAVDLPGRRGCVLNPEMAVFVTMNPGYAGRSNLPDNLKQLFRGVAMVKPDYEPIARVTLYTRGFRTAERLAARIVLLFDLCRKQLSDRNHYDFGLRALKGVLSVAGERRRDSLARPFASGSPEGAGTRRLGVGGVEGGPEERRLEEALLAQSVYDAIVPKLVSRDLPLFERLVAQTFSAFELCESEQSDLRREVDEVCRERHLVSSPSWRSKVFQVHRLQSLHRGLILMGPSGSGKTTAWSVLAEAVGRLEGREKKVGSKTHVFDPKAVTQEELFGVLDPVTREWTDGLFTGLLRRVAGEEGDERHWIVFDGDVDPRWVENLNSLLDDNRELTLPNGERLPLLDRVCVLFEVDGLEHATLATVSRCGIVWFDEDTVTSRMELKRYVSELRLGLPRECRWGAAKKSVREEDGAGVFLEGVADALEPQFEEGGLVERALSYARDRWHVMAFTRCGALSAALSLISQGILLAWGVRGSWNASPAEWRRKYLENWVVYSLLWGIGASMSLSCLEEYSDFLQATSGVSCALGSLLNGFVDATDGEWHSWSERLSGARGEELAGQMIPTVETVRRASVIEHRLREHRPLVLCGPPGSGKTMQMEETLKGLGEYEMVTVGFGGATTAQTLVKVLEQHCEYRPSVLGGWKLAPRCLGKWLVVFCDEMNLPSRDEYGTQRVIAFIRQLVERGRFWGGPEKRSWVELERIQFVGACNPSTDVGRVPLSRRFLKHALVIYVDEPSKGSLLRIYGAFNRAALELAPQLSSSEDSVTRGMVEFYLSCKKRFASSLHTHYVYSPRELTRWSMSMREALSRWRGAAKVEALARLWAYKALRLFQDRLVAKEERDWMDEELDATVRRHFLGADCEVVLERPILFSDWLTGRYESVSGERLEAHCKERMPAFCEEECCSPLVLFGEALDHILRIDQALRQPGEHMLLVGVPASGKTMATRFAAWLGGLEVIAIKAKRACQEEGFEEDLKLAMTRAGICEKRVCLVIDDSQVPGTKFLEKINALLTSGEVPGLFEGDSLARLVRELREDVMKKEPLLRPSDAELFERFTCRVYRNLHVIFTISFSTEEAFRAQVLVSPALLSRCVIDWFGRWSQESLFRVVEELASESLRCLDGARRRSVVSCMVSVHTEVEGAGGREKRLELEKREQHLSVGLSRLLEAEERVKALQGSLDEKGMQLVEKQREADQKLEVILSDQKEAECRHEELRCIRKRLAEQREDILSRQSDAESELGRVEPALAEAQRSVGQIKKKHLEEVRGFNHPPELVRQVMEAVLWLLKGKKLDWASIRRALQDQTFISSVLEFKPDSIASKLRSDIAGEYLSDERFTYESVNRASRACGPLVKWIYAQLAYAGILEKVNPLRQKIEQLEEETRVVEADVLEHNRRIEGLEESIGRYKKEYEVLISQSEGIKSEISTVREKLDRSVLLIAKLSQERESWESELDQVSRRASTVVGDSLLSAAFLAYLGAFGHGARVELLGRWRGRIESEGIGLSESEGVIEWLSSSDERLGWQAQRLPPGDHCVENAIILKRSIRCPLILDPSGQGVEFVLSSRRGEQEVLKCSRSDAAFERVLENALRFGLCLLVTDVDCVDWVLGSVLNREYRAVGGGRMVVSVGDREVDLSPAFSMVLSTRKSSVEALTSDLCSRATVVNFAVTAESLESQCMDMALRSEYPELHRRRGESVRLQYECRAGLERLKVSLLNALNRAEGGLLDDPEVLDTLEATKREAESLTSRVGDVEVTIKKIEEVSSRYKFLASSAARIYFALQRMSWIHFLYWFSLGQFLETVQEALLAEREASPEARERRLFSVVYTRVSESLLYKDRASLALKLVQIRLSGTSEELDNGEFCWLAEMRGAAARPDRSATRQDTAALLGLDDARMDRFEEFLSLNEERRGRLEKHIRQDSEAWRRFLASPTADAEIPTGWRDEARSVRSAFEDVLIFKALRLDRVTTGIEILAEMVFGDRLSLSDACGVERSCEHSRVIQGVLDSRRPAMLCSSAGLDAGSMMDELALRKNPDGYLSIAVGSRDSLDQIDRFIDRFASTGGWIHIKNVHLAPSSWLSRLEKRTHSLRAHEKFKLFLSSEISPNLPPELLRQFRVAILESMPGLRASLVQTLLDISPERMNAPPVERARLYFLLAWTHAVFQERLNYTPYGWSKPLGFSRADKLGALDSLTCHQYPPPHPKRPRIASSFAHSNSKDAHGIGNVGTSK
ncbi:dynein heavy chain, cytoplasmic-like [Schistocerca gregaria]|uniref:dynein heavy chain, cytoplasmic-like n=1 Tax=Schistocerca gregaria TaxID=7010 RepID=UPI00211DA640|nr:dynein heavy chain, cytoplasmic-like [Schistocerca gregaria]